MVNIKLIPQVLEKLRLNELRISTPWFESLIGSAAVAGVSLLPRNFFIYPCKLKVSHSTKGARYPTNATKQS